MNYIKSCNALVGSLKINYLARNAYAYLSLTKTHIRLCQFLLKKNLINGFITKESKIIIKMVYFKGEPLLVDLKNLSKPSKKVSKTYQNLIKFQKMKTGLVILDTNYGFMFLTEALQRKLGGTLIFRCRLLK